MLFELIQIEVQCSKNCFNISLSQEVGAFGNDIEKNSQKPRPKLKKYLYYIYTENICSAYNPMQMVVICKNELILKGNDSNFLTLKVA